MPVVRRKVMGRWMDINVGEDEFEAAKEAEGAAPEEFDLSTANQSYNPHQAAELGIHSQQDAQRMADEGVLLDASGNVPHDARAEADAEADMKKESRKKPFRAVDADDVPADADTP